MVKDFIKIKDVRVRINSIKRYAPMYETKLNVYYNSSRIKPELEVFTFDIKKERNDMLETLDAIFI